MGARFYIRSSLGALTSLLILVACRDKEPAPHSGGESGLECLNLNDVHCVSHGLYHCDDCGDVYLCAYFSSYDGLTWGLTGFPCKCVGEDGEFLRYDPETGEGDPECYTYDD